MPRNNKFLTGISLIIVVMFLLAGCGTPLPSSVGGLLTGRPVTSVTPVSSLRQMGGSKQGVPLVLSASVTLYVASAPAGFVNPFGITTDGTNLYMADYTTNNIRQITISSAAAVVTTIAGSITGAAGSQNATGTAASFSGPAGITTDGTNLYVADAKNHLIRKIVISTGIVTTLAGSTTAGYTDATGTSALFNFPYGITTDGTNLYVADTGNNVIRQIVISTGVVTTLAGSILGGNANGTGTGALFSIPYGITTDGINLYVADTGNKNIRQIVISTGVVTTIAGTGGVGFSDGIGTAASFNSPQGITTDGSNLYITDSNSTGSSNNIIRKMVLSTANVTTLAGTAGVVGSTDGVGTAASFKTPFGITTDGISLYIAEYGNAIIRKIQ